MCRAEHPPSVRDYLPELSFIRIEDGSGRAQTLHFGARREGVHRLISSNFPVPPDAGSTRVSVPDRWWSSIDPTVDRRSIPVRILSALYPVTTDGDRGDADAAYALASGSGPRLNARGDRRDRKSDDQPEQAADLRLVAGSRAVPTEFALMQNYRAHSTLLDGRIRALREASPRSYNASVKRSPPLWMPGRNRAIILRRSRPTTSHRVFISTASRRIVQAVRKMLLIR